MYADNSLNISSHAVHKQRRFNTSSISAVDKCQFLSNITQRNYDNCKQGCQTYSEIWTAVLGEVLITERELYDVNNHCTVAVKKHSGKMVSISQENGLVLPIGF